MKLMLPGRWIMGLMLLTAAATFAGEMTALQLVKEGNRYVGEQSKDKLISVRSEKSVGGLEPQIWVINYHNPDATFKVTQIKFGAGRKLDQGNPMRVNDYVTADKSPLDPAKIKVDSDVAIRLAVKDQAFEKFPIKATQLWLEKGDLDKGDTGPVWKVRVWAQKLSKPSEMATIGDVFISSTEAKVLRTELHLGRLD